MGVINSKARSLRRSLLNENAKLFGYSDGSFKIDDNGVASASIGGFLKDKKPEASVYLFRALESHFFLDFKTCCDITSS